MGIAERVVRGNLWGRGPMSFYKGTVTLGDRPPGRVEFAVVGGGPAGLSAAIAAARYGVEVAVLDENERPGGQLHKQIHKFFGSQAHGAGLRGMDIGQRLIQEAESSKVGVWLNTVVWGIFDGPRLGLRYGQKAFKLEAEKVLLATGACENVLVFPGWTLPGVMGAGAAQTMINIHRVLPGRKILMVGAGNVGLITAFQFLQAGAQVVAVVEAMPHVGGYAVHASKLRRCGVPILTRHTIKEAVGREGVERAVVGEVGSDLKVKTGTERPFDVDTVCLAVGLTPMAELAWLAGCQLVYKPDLGGHVPVHDASMLSTVDGLYVAGDLTGIDEAHTALEEGKVAGIAVAESLGHVEAQEARRLKEEARARLAALRACRSEKQAEKPRHP